MTLFPIISDPSPECKDNDTISDNKELLENDINLIANLEHEVGEVKHPMIFKSSGKKT